MEEQSHEAEESRRRDQLAPFADQIELIVRAFERSSRPYGNACAGWFRYLQAQKEDVVRRYAEDYALTHGRLPTGRAELRKGVKADFDALAAKVASTCAMLSLPKAYRLPRHQRVPFFRQQIDALVSAFDDRFAVGGDPDRRGYRNRLEFFLQDYVTDYERLPCGKMRIDPEVIPLSFIWYDMGEVDFNALRQAAGLPLHS